MNKVARLLPPGVKDIFGQPAHHLTRLNHELSAHFGRWGYEPIIPPTFEYFDNLPDA
ncbi:MAG: ATP phosphoribosyltransferase regulatory subunit [Ardenticatenia bacterium]|nr:ATP phosphoribosyltransferase regulatory subunit [Ardenticatenia bacterium]